MQTRPNRTVTPHSDANEEVIAPQYRHALAKRVHCAGRYPHETPLAQPERVSSRPIIR
jgi:hypothetical protein